MLSVSDAYARLRCLTLQEVDSYRELIMDTQACLEAIVEQCVLTAASS